MSDRLATIVMSISVIALASGLLALSMAIPAHAKSAIYPSCELVIVNSFHSDDLMLAANSEIDKREGNFQTISMAGMGNFSTLTLTMTFCTE